MLAKPIRMTVLRHSRTGTIGFGWWRSSGLLVFRLLALYHAKTDIFFDEAQYWLWSRDLAFGYFSKPPLIAWIIRLATEICGDAEWCVRAPSPILYTVSSIFVFLAGRALFGARVGFWSAVVFATLPGTSVSSLLISTDVPLIVCWTIALYAWIKLVETQRTSFALLVGAAIGVGLLAKYAAIYFFLCIAVDAWTDKRARQALGQGRWLAIGGLALALVAPNLIWNASHGFATFSHTAERAGWETLPINIGFVAEFLGTQFAVFGPILFATLLVLCRARLARQPRAAAIALARLLPAGAAASDRAGAVLARARQLGGCFLSRRVDPGDGGAAKRLAEAVPRFAVAARRHGNPAHARPGLRPATHAAHGAGLEPLRAALGLA